jgi:hypothetical protein
MRLQQRRNSPIIGLQTQGNGAIPLKGNGMKHLTTVTQTPNATESFFGLMIQTKVELMEDNTFLKEIL